MLYPWTFTKSFVVARFCFVTCLATASLAQSLPTLIKAGWPLALGLLTNSYPVLLIKKTNLNPAVLLIYKEVYLVQVYDIPTNSAVVHLSLYKPLTTHNSLICSYKMLMLETSAFKLLYSGQFYHVNSVNGNLFLCITNSLALWAWTIDWMQKWRPTKFFCLCAN